MAQSWNTLFKMPSKDVMSRLCLCFARWHWKTGCAAFAITETGLDQVSLDPPAARVVP